MVSICTHPNLRVDKTTQDISSQTFCRFARLWFLHISWVTLISSGCKQAQAGSPHFLSFVGLDNTRLSSWTLMAGITHVFPLGSLWDKTCLSWTPYGIRHIFPPGPLWDNTRLSSWPLMRWHMFSLGSLWDNTDFSWSPYGITHSFPRHLGKLVCYAQLWNFKIQFEHIEKLGQGSLESIAISLSHTRI